MSLTSLLQLTRVGPFWLHACTPKNPLDQVTMASAFVAYTAQWEPPKGACDRQWESDLSLPYNQVPDDGWLAALEAYVLTQSTSPAKRRPSPREATHRSLPPSVICSAHSRTCTASSSGHLVSSRGRTRKQVRQQQEPPPPLPRWATSTSASESLARASHHSRAAANTGGAASARAYHSSRAPARMGAAALTRVASSGALMGGGAARGEARRSRGAAGYRVQGDLEIAAASAEPSSGEDSDGIWAQGTGRRAQRSKEAPDPQRFRYIGPRPAPPYEDAFKRSPPPPPPDLRASSPTHSSYVHDDVRGGAYSIVHALLSSPTAPAGSGRRSSDCTLYPAAFPSSPAVTPTAGSSCSRPARHRRARSASGSLYPVPSRSASSSRPRAASADCTLYPALDDDDRLSGRSDEPRDEPPTPTAHVGPRSAYPVPCTLHPAPTALVGTRSAYPVPCTLYHVPCTHNARWDKVGLPCTMYPVPCVPCTHHARWDTSASACLHACA